MGGLDARSGRDKVGSRIGPAVVVGLLGQGIQLSRTPLMHEVEGARLGIRYVYRLLDTEGSRFVAAADPGAVLDAARFFGFAGLNVTYPFKQAIVPYLDSLSENAARIGAVNTVVLRDGRALGHNTDLWGFAESFRRNMQDAPHRHVLLLGAGGAGSAVSRALLQEGVRHLSVADVDQARAAALAGILAADFGAQRVATAEVEKVSPDSVDGVVNATPVGMAKSPGLPLPSGFLRPHMWVADIVYFPLETQLLRAARELGCRTLSGAPMAIHQAARAFELFTGLVPDLASLQSTFDAFDAPANRNSGDEPTATQALGRSLSPPG